MNPLRVCLDACIVSGQYGGVEQFIIGLASGLSQLDDADEQYFFLGWEDSVDWLRPYLGGACRLLLDGSAPEAPSWKRWAKRLVPFTRSAWHRWNLLSSFGAPTTLPPSSGLIERAKIDVMHFTHQSGFATQIPSIYHPHDLQYIHLPEFFTPRDRRSIDMQYRAMSAQAAMVAVASCWGKQDLVRQFDLRDDKVRVIPLAAPAQAYKEPTEADLAQTSTDFALPESFIFYPAQTWPHKNHVELLHALAFLRDRYGLRVPLVCSGHRNRHFREIQAIVSHLGLSDQARFLGFVAPLTVQCLYRLCRAVVIPTRFEGGGFPMMEAFSVGAAVACSNVTALPEQAGEAALLFDPTDHVQIADAIRSLWNDPALRKTLIERGHRLQQGRSWSHIAKLFRAHYRLIGGRELSEEDSSFVSRDPCHEPSSPRLRSQGIKA